MFFWDKPRPQKKFYIRECSRGEWEKFRRYHYLNTTLCSAAQCFGLYDENDIIGFCAILHQPHAKLSNLKRCSRLVILPDYQGIGLGFKFLSVIAKHYVNQKYQFSIVTSAKNMIGALNKSSEWVLIKYDRNICGNNKNAIDYKRKSMRSNCKVASFKYVGKDGKVWRREKDVLKSKKKSR